MSATPALSPANSTDVSPAFATVLQTPAGSVDEFDFSIGEPTGKAVKQAVPECWGHRGVGSH